jgi:SAM-dependent methyltransferase
MTKETKQFAYWQKMAAVDPDMAVIDPRDHAGYKNSYICQIRDLAFASALSSIPLQSPVLDFGCGTGSSTKALIQLGYTVKGVDIAPGLLEHAVKRCPEAEFQLSNGERIPADNESMAAVVTYVVLSYLVSAESVQATLTEMHRILATGGKLILIEQARRHTLIVEQGLKIQRSLQDWQQLLATAGFTQVRSKILRHGRFPTTPLIKLGLLPAKCWPWLMQLEQQAAHLCGVFPGDYAEVLFEAIK